jgi:hypothetical protein
VLQQKGNPEKMKSKKTWCASANLTKRVNGFCSSQNEREHVAWPERRFDTDARCEGAQKTSMHSILQLVLVRVMVLASLRHAKSHLDMCRMQIPVEGPYVCGHVHKSGVLCLSRVLMPFFW